MISFNAKHNLYVRISFCTAFIAGIAGDQNRPKTTIRTEVRAMSKQYRYKYIFRLHRIKFYGLKCPCDIHAELSINWKYANGYTCVCYSHESWISIRVFLIEWIFLAEYYHGHCMDTSTQDPWHRIGTCCPVKAYNLSKIKNCNVEYRLEKVMKE